jgi:nicotinamidase/pyrazinamidase
MSGRIFWDVDTQHDFMRSDGKLYVPEAETIIPNLKRLTDHAHRSGIRIVASADDHVLEHREISDQPDFETTFPPHCLRGTAGQAKIPETALEDPLVIEPDPLPVRELRELIAGHQGDILLHKHWFDVFTNPNTRQVVDLLDPDEVVVYGVALDVCDRYAIEGLLVHRPRTRLKLVVDAVKPIVAEKGEALLEDWQSRGVELITTERALGMTARTLASSAMTR